MSVDADLALVTLADAKTWLKIDSDETSEDALITLLVNRAGGFANVYCGRHFKTKGWTDYYDGDGSAELMLRNFPVTALTSLNVDALRSFGASTAIDVNANVMLDQAAGIVRLWNNGGRFLSGRGNVKAVYVAGYKDATDNLVPADLQEAALLLIMHSYKRHFQDQKIGLLTETIGDRTSTFVNEAIPKKAQTILDSYKMPAGASVGF